MKTTPILGLQAPELGDDADVTPIGANFEKLDAVGMASGVGISQEAGEAIDPDTPPTNVDGALLALASVPQEIIEKYGWGNWELLVDIPYTQFLTSAVVVLDEVITNFGLLFFDATTITSASTSTSQSLTVRSSGNSGGAILANLSFGPGGYSHKVSIGQLVVIDDAMLATYSGASASNNRSYGAIQWTVASAQYITNLDRLYLASSALQSLDGGSLKIYGRRL